METDAFYRTLWFEIQTEIFSFRTMSKFSSYFFTAILAVGSFAAACNGDASQTQKTERPTDLAAFGKILFTDTLPALAEQEPVGFRDMNAYTSNDHFCIASIVDNASDLWQQIWVKTQLLDANGNILTVNGDSSILLQTFSDAVPPRGATSFFCAIPLNQVSGTPVNCRMEGAGSVSRSAGPILIATDVGGVRAMYADKDDPKKVVEKTFNVQATIENPLDFTAYHPKMVLLVYGKDYKLYFAQMVGLDDPTAPMKQEREGPLLPHEKRAITCLILYEYLPKPLQEMLIGRVDVQVHEAR